MANSKYLNSIKNLESRFNFEKEEKNKFPFFKLERTYQLMELLGNPQNSSSFTIHVAGTNGKGSVSSNIDSVLSKVCKTGLLTSPHLSNYTERIKLDGKEISKGLFADTYEEISDKVHDFERENKIEFTFFEIITAMGFLIFEQKDVDVKILETGLGGTFDSTNVVESDISIITPISDDHKKVLGGSIQSITENKAGIISKNSKVIVSKQKKIPKEILQNNSRLKNSKFIEAKYTILENPKIINGRMNVKISIDEVNYEIKSKSIGSYHIENIATSIKAIKEYSSKISKETINYGLGDNWWPCRGDIYFYKERIFFIDGAHNKEGFENLITTLNNFFNKNYVFIFGTNSNHDIKPSLDFAKKISKKNILTRSSHPKSLCTNIIAKKFNKFKLNYIKSTSIENALKIAISETTKEDLIVVAGSLFVSSEISSIIK